jgi:hypothetical protein
MIHYVLYMFIYVHIFVFYIISDILRILYIYIYVFIFIDHVCYIISDVLLMMTLLGSKHVKVIKEDLVFQCLPVALTIACAGVYVNILITQVHGYEPH